MSLEGNLSAFGISEILQLIAVQQKSGMLSISSQDRSAVLFFRDGLIMSTRDRRRKTKDPLKDYLTRYGILSREDLIRLTQISAQSKLDVTEIIVSEEFMSEEDMQKHYRNHIQETVHEILTWEQCSYKFIPGTDIIDGIKSWGEFGIEGMLMESMRRIDEFPQALEYFPDINMTVRKIADPDKDMEMTSNEKSVLAMLGEDRTLNHLITNGKLPKYEIYEALKHLKDKELVEGDVDEDAEFEINLKKAGKRKKKKEKKKKANVIPLGFSVILFAGAVFLGAKNLAPYVQNYLGEDAATVNVVTRNQTEDKLRWILEAYRAQNGGYPDSLSLLERDGLASASFLSTVKRYGFRYHLTPGAGHYTLL